MQRPKTLPLTHSEFYRIRRPEYFSDSSRTYEIQLPREHLAYELSQISTNQKQDDFETLCRRLAEKFIAPNLIPQVGPTGGGDGKTDFETYPVSQTIFERWFIPENSWNNKENWAFAISAKEDWKSKAKGDIKKIIETGRGYTRIYFITNQKPSSKKKKDAQDEFINEFKIDIVILDGEWILEKIYGSDLINLVVDTLNLSDVYKKEKINIGEKDISRLKKLDEIEERINNPKRYSEYDYQLVEDALDAAILTRNLEKPKDEVIGKFERTLRLGLKINNSRQLVRIYYQRAWTYLNWYDDYNNFINEYNSFKLYLHKNITITGVELCFNLINLLRSLYSTKKEDLQLLNIDFYKEENELRILLEECIKDNTKPSTALIAKTYKSFLILFEKLINKTDLSSELNLLKQYFEESVNHLEYPLENFVKIIDVFGEILPENKEYDNLVDALANIQATRASELTAGETFLKRGYQKLDKDFHKESVIYFGKAIIKLAKEESKDSLYLTLIGLYYAYSNSGLYWAAYNSLLAAMSITIKDFYKEGKITQRFYNCIKEAIKIESFIGRIPVLLTWHELYQVVSKQFQRESVNENEASTLELIDGCLCVRLINIPYEKWSKLTLLPSVLEKESLWLSQDTCLFILGYTELLSDNYVKNFKDVDKPFDSYYKMVANQPFKEQIAYETDLLDNQTLEINSVILGTQFSILFNRNKNLMFFAEMVLAYLESFLATSFSDVYPTTEKITIRLNDVTSDSLYKITSDKSSSEFLLQINFRKIKDATKSDLSEVFIRFASQIILKNFLIKDAESYLETLFKKEELVERQSIVFEHLKCLNDVLGENPKIFLDDWDTTGSLKKYPFKRKDKPILKNNKELIKKEIEPLNPDRTKHNHRRVSSVIDNYLWDTALWQAFGFFATREFPFGIILGFKNGDIGKQIFENWIKRFGKQDKNDEIMISIIRGVDKEHPTWYRVHISKEMNVDSIKETELITTASRCHDMFPETNKNVENLINVYLNFRRYILFPAEFNPNGSVGKIYYESGILKNKLTIKNAWEIGENDIDSVVIRKEDNPIIPISIQDAPILGLLKKMNEL